MKKRHFGSIFRFSREGVFLLSIPAVILAYFSVKPAAPFELIVSSILLFIAAPYFITRSILNEKTAFMGWRKGNTVRGMSGVLLGWLVFLPFLYLLSQRPDFFQLYPIFPQMRTGVTALVLMEFLVMLPAFIGFQNFIFGYIYGGMAKLMGKGKTLLLISFVVMPLFHIGKPGMEIVLAFFVGLAACWIRERSKSVIYPIVFGWGLSFILDILVIYHISQGNI